MAIFTKQSAQVQEDLFRTVDGEKQVIPTEGYYIIVREERRPETSEENAIAEAQVKAGIITVSTVKYLDGIAPFNPLFQPETDKVFIYPNGYFGTSGIGDVLLGNTAEIQKKIAEKQQVFIASKIGVKR